RDDHDIDLMQHADGELDARGEHEVEARLTGDERARAVVESLGQVGELVRGHLELAADAIPARRFEAMWSEIDKQLDLAADKAPEPAPIPARAETSTPRAGAWGKVTRWLDKKLGYVITGVVSAGAVAAITIAMRSGSTTTIQGPGPIDPQLIHQPAQIESLDT